jgi:hypothetical protein
MSRLPTIASAFLIAAIAALGPWHAPARAAAAPVERFTATAVTSAKSGTRPHPVAIEILIERWSTDAERDRLIETLKSKGPSGLLTLIREMPGIGFMSSATSKGTPLHFAHARPAEDGGRHIIMASERPSSESEPRSRFRRGDDYPFTIVDFHVDSSGSGEGKVAYAAHLALNEKTGALEIGKYAAEPVYLTSVKSERAK